MNENEIYKTTLIYCGREFYTHVYKKGDVYKVFFANKAFTLYEFYTNGYANVPLILDKCKNDELLDVSWKYEGKTNKKIILDAKPTEKESK